MNLACNTCFMDTVDDGVCRSCGAEQTEGHRDRRALAAGTDIGGKYTVGKVLGAGGFGITYLAQDVSLKRRVALKEFFPVGLVARGPDRMSVTCNSPNDEAPFERGLKRFFGEGQILARFNHPNIVRVFEVFRANGTAYLAMEFLDGKTLKDWITLNGRLETEQALQVMGFVLDALRAVHATHVVHRDVKPDNIYLTQQGRTLLLDFGGAKQLTAEGDRSMDAMFAHGYAAPEQYYADSGKIGPWTDVYACGATLYKMLTGQTMRGALDRYSEDPPLAWLRVTVAETIRAAVVKAVVLKHAERYQSIEEFQSAIHMPMELPTVVPYVEPVVESVAETSPPERVPLAEAPLTTPSGPTAKKWLNPLLLLLVGSAAAAAYFFLAPKGDAATAVADTMDTCRKSIVASPEPNVARAKADELAKAGNLLDCQFLLYKYAGEKGDLAAARKMGMFYDPDTWSKDKSPMPAPNPIEAARWHKQAAEGGDTESQYRYGMLLKQGRTDAADGPEQAQVWLRKAAEQGNVSAKEALAQ